MYIATNNNTRKLHPLTSTWNQWEELQTRDTRPQKNDGHVVLLGETCPEKVMIASRDGSMELVYSPTLIPVKMN